MLRLDSRLTKNFDYMLLFSVILISFIGIMTIGSASWNKEGNFPWNPAAQSQLYWTLIGIVLLFLVIYTDYEFFGRMAYPLFFFVLGLLILVLVVGKSGADTKRWLKIGFLPAFQPSEFAKLSLIIVLSHHFANIRKDAITFRNLLWPGLLTGIYFFLIEREPDLGTEPRIEAEILPFRQRAVPLGHVDVESLDEFRRSIPDESADVRHHAL